MSENRDTAGEVIHLPSPLLHPRATDALLLAGAPYPPAGAGAVKERAEPVPFKPAAEDAVAARETERAG